MSVTIDLNDINYPNHIVFKETILEKKIVVPFEEVVPFVEKIFQQHNETCKNEIPLSQKIQVANVAGIESVYRRPDIARTILKTAGVMFLVYSLSQNEGVKKLHTFGKNYINKEFPNFCQSQMIQFTNKAINTISENKGAFGLGAIALAECSNQISEEMAMTLHRVLNNSIYCCKEIKNGVVNGCVATANSIQNTYRWARNNPKKTIAILSTAAIAGAGFVYLKELKDAYGATAKKAIIVYANAIDLKIKAGTQITKAQDFVINAKNSGCEYIASSCKKLNDLKNLFKDTFFSK